MHVVLKIVTTKKKKEKVRTVAGRLLFSVLKFEFYQLISLKELSCVIANIRKSCRLKPNMCFD